MKTTIADIINLDRYPLDNPADARLGALMNECRMQTESNALCLLPGFVWPEVVRQMANELESLIVNASRFDIKRQAYIEPVDPSLPDFHPRKVAHTTKYHQVLNYQVSNESLLRQLFYWQPLTDFLGKAMGFEQFYRCDCPHLALTAKIASEGDTDGWHYDSNEAVFSLLLQDAEDGGEFELIPNVRQGGEENYEIVSAAFRNSQQYSVRYKFQPGTLVLFKGRASLHRVTPVVGPRRRIIALFSYDTKPGHFNTQSYVSLVHSQMPVPGIALN